MNPRVLIVDDEPLARSKIMRLLERRNDATVIGSSRTAAEAVTAIREGKPDLVFLDIQLPDQSGFWVLDEVGATTVPAVVFVTAYDAFALRAFEAHAIDYLLKPFDASRFERAYDRARTWLGARAGGATDSRIQVLLADVREGEASPDAESGYLTRIVAPAGNGEAVLRVDEVEWFEAAGNYVEAHLATDAYLFRDSLAGIESRLDPARFVRIHRRLIVNLERVERLESMSSGDGVVTLRGGRTLRVSRNHRLDLRAALDQRPSRGADA
jgi:two-component system LytT family response regulator